MVFIGCRKLRLGIQLNRLLYQLRALVGSHWPRVRFYKFFLLHVILGTDGTPRPQPAYPAVWSCCQTTGGLKCTLSCFWSPFMLPPPDPLHQWPKQSELFFKIILLSVSKLSFHVIERLKCIKMYLFPQMSSFVWTMPKVFWCAVSCWNCKKFNHLAWIVTFIWEKLYLNFGSVCLLRIEAAFGWIKHVAQQVYLHSRNGSLIADWFFVLHVASTVKYPRSKWVTYRVVNFGMVGVLLLHLFIVLLLFLPVLLVHRFQALPPLVLLRHLILLELIVAFLVIVFQIFCCLKY